MNPEGMMDGVVRVAGGERVDSLLPPTGQRAKNADYLFRADNVIAEFKSLQQEVFTPAYRQKLDALVHEWTSRGLIYVFGRAAINLRTLPAPCQQEWMRLLTLPLQSNVIQLAHSQIKETKKTLCRPEAQGLLILANEGNVDYEPSNLMLLVANILKKKHPNGSPQYASIHAVSIMSHTLLVSSPDLPARAFFWLNGHRPFCDERVKNLQSKLERAWYEAMSKRVGHPIPRFQMNAEKLENLRFS